MSGIVRRGFEGKLYYGTAGTMAATEVVNCEDLDYQTEPERGETTVRGDGTSVPIVTSRVVALKPTITWRMLNKPSDTTLSALIAAARTGAAVALRLKSYSSGTGFDGDCTLQVAGGFPLKGIATFEFTAEATDDEGRTPLLNS